MRWIGLREKVAGNCATRWGLRVMDEQAADNAPVVAPRSWLDAAASAYLAALWGSLVVIAASVGQPPTLDATRPGGALIALVFVAAGASALGRGTAGISGALAGAASAYALAIITTLRAAERNWAFIAPGPASAWQTEVTEALLRSLVFLGAAAVVGALGRALFDRRQPSRFVPRPSRQPSRVMGPAAVVLIALAALGGTGALVGAAADTSIVLPAQVPTITATDRGDFVMVEPSSIAPGEASIVTETPWDHACDLCAGIIDFFGPLSDAELVRLEIGTVMDDWINVLPRPDQLWYGGNLLSEGTYAFALSRYPGPDDPPRLEGLGILTVSAGPTPAVVPRVPGDAPLFAWVERLVLILSGAALGLVAFRRRRIARLARIERRLATVGVAALGSLVLAGGLAFYVSFAGSPF